jgi:hypothetical protein
VPFLDSKNKAVLYPSGRVHREPDAVGNYRIKDHVLLSAPTAKSESVVPVVVRHVVFDVLCRDNRRREIQQGVDCAAKVGFDGNEEPVLASPVLGVEHRRVKPFSKQTYSLHFVPQQFRLRIVSVARIRHIGRPRIARQVKRVVPACVLQFRPCARINKRTYFFNTTTKRCNVQRSPVAGHRGNRDLRETRQMRSH